MYGYCVSQRFLNGVNSFIRAAKAYVARHPRDKGYVSCPCRDCKNLKLFCNLELTQTHLITRGFVEDYKIWHKHGEKDDNVANDQGGDDESIQTKEVSRWHKWLMS